MSYWIVDIRNRIAQQVTADATEPDEPRFLKIEAPSAREAIERAIFGTCECICEPRGSNGLEGYDLGKHYRFRRVTHGMRVYPTRGLDYSEFCGPGVFKRFFKVV